MVHVTETIANALVILQVNIVANARQIGTDLNAMPIVIKHYAMVIACIKMV